MIQSTPNSSPKGTRRERGAQQVDRRLFVERGQDADRPAPDHDVAAVLDHEQAALGAQQRLDVAAVGRAADGEVHALGQAEVARIAVAHVAGPLDAAGPAMGQEAGMGGEPGPRVGAQRTGSPARRG